MAVKISFAFDAAAATTHPWEFFVSTLAEQGVTVEVTDLTAQPLEDLAAQLAACRLRGEPRRLVIWGALDQALELRAFAGLGQMVIVPAPDDAIPEDPAWWQRFQTHRFLAFSRCLHESLLRAGQWSAHFQYYARPVPPAQLADVAAERSALLWEPRGTDAASLRMAIAQCRVMGLRRLQVAARADDAALEQLAASSGGFVELQPAGRGPARRDIVALAQRHICLLAPQPQTGVDQMLLHALASGRIVIASDTPLRRDYIGHQASGLLYRPASPADLPWLGTGQLRSLASAAHAKARRGHVRWQADVARLLSVLAGDDQRWSMTDRSAAFGNAIRRHANETARGLAEAASNPATT